MIPIADPELDGRDARQGGETTGASPSVARPTTTRSAIPREAGEQLLGRCRADEAPLVEDRDVIGDALDVVEDVGGVEDRRVAAQPFHQVEDVAPADGVERARRLVEQEHLRPADEGLGDAEPLAHPAGVGPGRAIGGVRDAGPLQRLVDPTLDRVAAPRGRSPRRSGGSGAPVIQA